MGLRWMKEKDGPFGVGRDPCGMLRSRGGTQQEATRMERAAGEMGKPEGSYWCAGRWEPSSHLSVGELLLYGCGQQNKLKARGVHRIIWVGKDH